MKPISEYMTKSIISVVDDTPLIESLKLMRREKIGALLVRDRQDEPIGIFTERDLLAKLDVARPERLKNTVMADIMTRNLITVEHDENYNEVLDLMRQKNIRHLPVTQMGKIVGIVSLRDIMCRYQESLEALLAKRETQLLANIEKIRESEERFRTIFHNSAVAITFADEKERIVACNKLAVNLLGFETKELLNKTVRSLYPPEEWKRIRSYQIRQHGKDRHLETQVYDKDGCLIDVDISISVLKNPDGEITGSIGIMRDIRERKQMAVKLDQSLRELKNIKSGLDHHAIVAITDPAGKIIYANDKFCEISQYSRQELLGQDHRIINSGYHSKDFFRNLWKTIANGKVWKGEIRNRAKDGTFYWVDSTIVPLLDENGQPFQYVSIRSDITKRKGFEDELRTLNKNLLTNANALKSMVQEREKAYRQLKETQQQMIQIEKMATIGTLAAGFAHEIKNPLAVIMQGMERLERAAIKRNAEEEMPYIKIVKSASQRANDVITSILKYSRSSQMDMKPVDICQVIHESVSLIRNNAQLNNVQIHESCSISQKIVYGDQLMLEQVIFDLMANAIDAMPRGGDIDIVVGHHIPQKGSQDQGQVVIKIKDTGEGIPENRLPKIFDPFYTTKEPGKGTGLGLSTVYLIVERHHGHISVESKLNKGTTFTIALPVEDQSLLEPTMEEKKSNI